MSAVPDAAYWIAHLGLQPHPEGGWFRETYRAAESVAADALPARFDGARSISTAVYFLITRDTFSALHRIRSDELWHFYAGAAVTVTILDGDGRGGLVTTRLGNDPMLGEAPQITVPAGAWFGAEVEPPVGQPAAPHAYALVGCTVAPGFDFADFELGARATLVTRYPRHRSTIERLTRVS